MKVSSLIYALVFAALAAPLVLVAAQIDEGNSTTAPLAVAVLENRTTSTTDFIDETTTVVTTVLRTEEEVNDDENETEEGNNSLRGEPGDAVEHVAEDDNKSVTYIVNETTIVVTTVKGIRSQTQTVITTLFTFTADNVAPDETKTNEEDDDGVKELLGTPAMSVTPSTS